MSDKLALTQSLLNEPKTLQGVFEIEPFKHSFIGNYCKTTGKSNGALIWERERVLFMKALQSNQKLEECSRFSIYSSFIELGVSGLTLQDGLSYIIPYGKTAQFQIGWKGRLEHISWMADVIDVQEPQVVYQGDAFKRSLGESPRIILHEASEDIKRKEQPKVGVYFIVVTGSGGVKTFYLDAADIYKVRDTYSKPYIYYIKANGSWPDGRPMDKPYWLTNEEAAFKKTIIKNVYNWLPNKSNRLKALDSKIRANFDPETETNEDEEIDYEMNGTEAAAKAPRKPKQQEEAKKHVPAGMASDAPYEDVTEKAEGNPAEGLAFGAMGF